MSLRALLIASTLCSLSTLAHADTVQYSLNASGTGGGALVSIALTPVTKFDPSLGTLNDFTISFSGSGTVSLSAMGNETFLGVFGPSAFTPITPTHSGFVSGGPGAHPISYSGSGVDSNAIDLAYMEGTGTSALTIKFSGGNVGQLGTSGTGTITYDYTPAVSATPEPNTLVLLGTGLLGLAGAARKRFASLTA